MHRAIPSLCCLFLIISQAAAQVFDFARPEDCHDWHATHDVSSLEHTPEGLAISISGSDPYITGPERDFPPEHLLWMTVKLKSEEEGMAQVFYFNRGPSEEHSIRF